MQASEVLDRAQRMILDETGVRWPLRELLLWINDAQREIVLLKPGAFSKNIVLALAVGSHQAVPLAYTGLLRVVRNITSGVDVVPRVSGRSIRMVSREILDHQTPDWHSGTKKQEVKHFTYDELDPMSFYVYPPNDGTGKVEAVLPAIPPAIAIAVGADQDLLAAYAVDLPLNDLYFNPTLDYVLYRAYSKDASFAGNAQRAAAHYAQFANSIGVSIRNAAALNPNVPITQGPPA